MTLSEASPYFAMIVTICVWALTQKANRDHEVFKERLKRRADMFVNLLPVLAELLSALTLLERDKDNQQPFLNAWKTLGDYRIKMICYGTDEERHLYEKLISAIERRDVKTFPYANNELVDLVTKNLRTELGVAKQRFLGAFLRFISYNFSDVDK